MILGGLPIYIKDLCRGNFVIKTSNSKRFEINMEKIKLKQELDFLLTLENQGLHKVKIIKSIWDRNS